MLRDGFRMIVWDVEVGLWGSNNIDKGFKFRSPALEMIRHMLWVAFMVSGSGWKDSPECTRLMGGISRRTGCLSLPSRIARKLSSHMFVCLFLASKRAADRNPVANGSAHQCARQDQVWVGMGAFSRVQILLWCGFCGLGGSPTTCLGALLLVPFSTAQTAASLKLG